MSASPRKKRPSGKPSRAESQTAPTRKQPRPSATGRAWWFPALQLAAAVVLYWPALGGPFVYDDYDMLEGFSAVRTGTLNALIDSGRPVLMASFVLNERLGGFEPFGFHFVNVLLHGLNAVLLWRFCLALFVPGRFGERVEAARGLFVYGAPLLFLVSPMQTESVAYISSRSEVLSTAFYLAGLWAFVVWRERNPWVTAGLSLLFLVLAAGSKQDKITLPVAILLLDYLILSKRGFSGLKKSLPTYAMFGLGMVAGFFIVIRPFLFAQSAGFNLDWQAYLFTQFRVLFRYAGQLIAPLGLNIDPDVAVSHSLGENFSWLALPALVALLAAAWRFREQAPLPVFGGLFFLLAIAPSSSFYPLLDYAAERRVYLPAVGFFLLILWLLVRAFPKESKTPWAVLAAACLVYGGLTIQRAQVWSSELSLWQDAARKSPDKARPLTWLGRIYFEAGRTAEAVRYWTQAEERVEPGSDEHAYLLGNLGLAAATQKDYEQAVRHYERAVEMKGGDSRLWAQLAVANMRLGREEKGWQLFDVAMKRRRMLGPETFMLRGQEYYRIGEYEKALADYEAALSYRPGDPTIQERLNIVRQAAERNR